jgi:uncharacterized protein YdaU (DUF1376 family)
VSKKTDIWMPLYIGEYMADTMSFTTEQHGAYMLLLMACWREKGKPLTGTDQDMATIAGLTQPKWRAMKDKLLAKFIVSEDGKVTHKRGLQEVMRAQAVSKKRSEAGKNGASKRWQKDGKPMANAMANGMANASQNDGQSQSHTNSVTTVTGGEPPTDRDLMFSNGVPLLTAAGVAEKHARSMLAGLAKAHGDAAVVQALNDCAAAKPVQPVSWLQAALRTTSQSRPAGPGNKYAGAAAAIFDGATHV